MITVAATYGFLSDGHAWRVHPDYTAGEPLEIIDILRGFALSQAR